jgi:geranylgeranylglycerol-phosphate geranylgeranyltransferase
MNTLLPYIKIVRPGNALMTGIAIVLGYWLSKNTTPLPGLALLVFAGICATAFGNVINDLSDIATDRISHPNRPLPQKELSPAAAWTYLVFLALWALSSAFFVSKTHIIATLIPLTLLTLYTFYFKGTPLFGNILVSLLVAYALLFGGLNAPLFHKLMLPAMLAFILNLIREIIKDLQDKPGDSAAGILTTAQLPHRFLKAIVFSLSGLYLMLVFMPTLLGHFGIAYAVVCGVIIVPLHCYWIALFARNRAPFHLANLSRLLKFEMLAGLAALALDQVLYR